MGSGHPAQGQLWCLGSGGEVGADKPSCALPHNAANRTAEVLRVTLLPVTMCLAESLGLRREGETGLPKDCVVTGPPLLHTGAGVVAVLSPARSHGAARSPGRG